MHDSFDIAIIGGGAAGVAAACSAAMSGMSVVIIEKEENIGGLATNAEVGTICGLYKYNDTSEFEYHVGKFTREFSEQLQNQSKSFPNHDGTGLKYLPFEKNEFELLCRDLLTQYNVTVMNETTLVNVSEQNKRITGIEIESKNGSESIRVNALVDASGVSCVSKLLAHELIATHLLQSASQVFSLENVSYTTEQQLALVLLSALRRGIVQKELVEGDDRIHLVPSSLKNGSVSLKITLPINNTTFLESEIQEEAQQRIRRIVDYLRLNVDGLKSILISSFAKTLGVRIADRPIGKMTLSVSDVVGCKKFTSSIAKGNWPLEIWSHEKRVEIIPIKENDYYDIPAECLISEKITNLFFAGRIISASDEAIASARVIGTCLQTGYAAGKLATGFLQEEKLEEIVSKLQREQF